GEEAPIVVGVSGASGAPIAMQVLKALAAARVPVALVVSAGAVALLREECGLAPEALTPYASVVYSDDDLAAPIASGSRATRGMVVVPCSGSTAAKIALGLGDTLLTRAAQVHLKERRRLVVLDAAPPYYLHPRTVDDQTSYLAGKVLDQFGVPHQLYRGWRSEGA